VPSIWEVSTYVVRFQSRSSALMMLAVAMLLALVL
jgi:hypothetical protein